ncbi:hypothetical protein [Cypionkella sp.]|uniref:hypothetical protein n=1 Tax=Cypionkella sp. TaxID=2811411 RepID=UPI002608F2AB|nr:hypothetical protein [Cypionkella sp.]MDB5664481.1 hypothetical protein [Cypionkella sp.]
MTAAKVVSVSTRLGWVIEFNMGNAFVYGVVVEEDNEGGDHMVMYRPSFERAVGDVGALSKLPIRCKFKFFAKFAKSKRQSDILRVIGTMDVASRPMSDGMFRVSLGHRLHTGGLVRGKWQILNGKDRVVVPIATEAIGCLSDADLPNLEYIKDYYHRDLYPWSAVLTELGQTEFDPIDFEAKMRANLIG